MMAYRICWMLFCGLLGALGAVMALTWSLTNVIVVLGMASLTGAVVAMVALADPDRPKRPPQEQRRIVARSTALAAGGTLSFIGLGALVGAATAVLLLVIAVGGSPYVIRYCVRWLSEHGHFASLSSQSVRPNPADRSPQSAPAPVLSTEPEQASQPQVAPGALSDEALCVAWRASFSALLSPDPPTGFGGDRLLA
jgi:hypothetical protein